MAEVLILLGKANLALAAAIVLILILRGPVRRLAGARIAYGLWLLPLLAVVAVMAPARTRMVLLPPVADRAFGVIDVGSVPAGPLVVQSAHADPLLILFALWIAGVVVSLLRVWRHQQRTMADVQHGAIGPAVVGVFRPRVVEPHDFAQRFTPEEQRLVLAHEQTHLARHDTRINAVEALIRCACWFNPLVHAAAVPFRVDQEMACDEAVITRFPRARPAYVRALAKTQLANRPLPLGCYWPSGTEHPLLERIAMINRDSFSRGRRLIGAGALALLCATASAAAWAAQPVRMIPVAAAQAKPMADAKSPSANAGAPVAGVNRLSPGRRLRITILKEPGLSAEQLIDAEGFITLPMVGQVYVAGLAPDAVKVVLRQKLTHYLATPAEIQITLPAPGANAAAITRAVAAGDSGAVAREGGTTKQVLAALHTRALAAGDGDALKAIAQLSDARDQGRIQMGLSSGYDAKTGHYSSGVMLLHMPQARARPNLSIDQDLHLASWAVDARTQQTSTVAPDHVCLSNDCGTVASVKPKEKTLEVAVQTGDILAAYQVSGKAQDVAAALINDPDFIGDKRGLLPETARLLNVDGRLAIAMDRAPGYDSIGMSVRPPALAGVTPSSDLKFTHDIYFGEGPEALAAARAYVAAHRQDEG